MTGHNEYPPLASSSNFWGPEEGALGGLGAAGPGAPGQDIPGSPGGRAIT